MTTTTTTSTLASLFTSTTTTSAGQLTAPATTSTATSSLAKTTAEASKTLTLTPATSSSAPGLSIGQKKEETKSMTMSQLDNFLNIWAVEVRDTEATFHEQVAEINNWDKKLTENGTKLIELNKNMENLKESQANINYDLDFVACHLTELNDYLTDLEKKSDENKTFCPSGKIDQQRRQLYDHISNLDVEIKRVHEELNELIESMNQASNMTEVLNPVTQIGSILNSHIASLQLVDKTIEKTQNYLSELTTLKESTNLTNR
ncbi:nuclear pore glycoprotein p62-like [Cimex lectularius]|uniref:Nucleoporin NSP1-like C-terminal domain-containing protein n=1 Tax=Cimex lectularius TaxID=79782 RepID=A0A8I6TBN7_CIMLE|nr:nuclear pore glycoprotein p62-like [Cimex lectularius]